MAMRNFIVLLLTSTVVGFLVTRSTAQEPQDAARVLAGLLKSVKQKENVEARIDAIAALGDFGPKAAPALPDLLDALQTNNQDLRLNAAITLAKIGKAAVGPVAGQLSSPDIDTKFYALWALGWIGPDAKEVVPAIIKLMADKDEPVRRKAAFALGQTTDDPAMAVPILIRAFKDESNMVREAAAESVAKFGKTAVPPLLDVLKGQNSPACRQAASVLGEIGTDAKEAIPLLKDLLLSKNHQPPDPPARIHYALVLAKFGKEALPALAAGFKDARDDVRSAAAQGLAKLGNRGADVLTEGLSDKNVATRRLSAQALGPMRIGDEAVVLALANALSDEDDYVRVHSINALRKLGAKAKPAAEQLRNALTDFQPHVRSEAHYLLRVCREDPDPAAQKALKSENAKVRIPVASLMLWVKSEDKDTIIPILVEGLKHADIELRVQAAWGLAQYEVLLGRPWDHPDRLVPIFAAGLKDKSARVRYLSLQGFAMMRSASREFATSVAEALRDPDENVRNQAPIAVWRVDGDIDKILPILTKHFKEGDPILRAAALEASYPYHIIFDVKLKDLVVAGLKDKDDKVRQMALMCLAHRRDLADLLPLLVPLKKDTVQIRIHVISLFQKLGKAGIPHLTELLMDPDEDVRFYASEALKKIK